MLLPENTSVGPLSSTLCSCLLSAFLGRLGEVVADGNCVLCPFPLLFCWQINAHVTEWEFMPK